MSLKNLFGANKKINMWQGIHPRADFSSLQDVDGRKRLRELEIYIHIPFCVRKCGYCDFLSAPAIKEQRDRYVQTLLEEIRGGAPVSALPCFLYTEPHDYIVTSVFFGGGTPSLLPAPQIAEILDALRARFYFSEDAEISIECNPGSFSQNNICGRECKDEEGKTAQISHPEELEKSGAEERRKSNAKDWRKAEKAEMEAYLACGINRISFGLQSADDAELAVLGRIHTFEMFLHSYEAARAAGFTNINVDLMSALPGQSVKSWENTLQRVLTLAPEHISAYSLIIEEGTPFYEKYHEDDLLRAGGEQPRFLPSEEDERHMVGLTERILGEAGYVHYEISNYALPGYECRHNIGYWRGTEYMGFGLGASSLLRNVPATGECAVTKGSVRCKNPTDHAEYERLVLSGDRSDNGRDVLSLPTCDVGGALLSSPGCDTDSVGQNQNIPVGGTHNAGQNQNIPVGGAHDVGQNQNIPAFDEESFQILSVNDEMSEFMFLGLRMLSGVSENEFFSRFGIPIDTVYGAVLERLLSLKLLRRENGRIFLTRRGLDLSNPVMAEFLL
ncbi:MAG: radical SAM protein [Lachnospiraceae bacterium]|nr:radical SAM protein [Lachnospiraceae bacterium]